VYNLWENKGKLFWRRHFLPLNWIKSSHESSYSFISQSDLWWLHHLIKINATLGGDWNEQDILTVDPTRLELIGANEPSLIYGVQKLMASKELDNSSGCDSEMEPSVTNTHCFFWWGAVKTSPTCTMTAATSNSLNKPNNNYWVYNFSLFTTRRENGGKAKTS
jgi:hypothetical protein